MKWVVVCSALTFSWAGFAQENQQTYKVSVSDPLWVQKLYEPNPNLFELRELYHTYYQTHPFVKNKHTQQIKRIYWHCRLWILQTPSIREFPSTSLTTTMEVIPIHWPWCIPWMDLTGSVCGSKVEPIFLLPGMTFGSGTIPLQPLCGTTLGLT